MDWFKFYHGVLDSTGKLARASRMTGCTYMECLGAWAGLLCLASKSPERGTLLIEVGIPYDIPDLAEILRLGTETMSRLLESFEDLRMVNRVGDAWVITNWSRRQYSESRDRVRALRARRKAESVTSGVTVTPDVTECNAESTEYRVQSTDCNHPALPDDDQSNVRALISQLFGRLMVPQAPTDLDWAELGCLIEEYGQESVYRFLREAETRCIRRRGVLPYIAKCLSNAKGVTTSADSRHTDYR